MKKARSQSQNDKVEPVRDKIQKIVWIKASPEVIFRALTHSRDLEHWFCDRVFCDPREGGEIVAIWESGKLPRRGRAVFTRFLPGKAIELHWIDDGCGPEEKQFRHTLTYEIRSKSDMTELHMLDAGEPIPDEEVYEFLDQGWNSVLLELKDYCERKQRALKRRSTMQ